MHKVGHSLESPLDIQSTHTKDFVFTLQKYIDEWGQDRQLNENKFGLFWKGKKQNNQDKAEKCLAVPLLSVYYLLVSGNH